MKTIDSLTGHYIICGLGRVGRNAAELLCDSHQSVVVVDVHDEDPEHLDEDDWLYVHGDATNDDVLEQAGIGRAKALLVCTGDDADNLFIVLSARALNPNLFIVSRSSHLHNESKMLRAGANRVISPYGIGGQRMANLVLRPNVADFFDVVTLNSGLEIWLEELTIAPMSPLVGKTLTESQVRQRTGVTLVILQRIGQQVITPGGDTVLEANDEIIALGTREQLAKLEQLASG